jgi:hypothetical protein
MHLLFLHEMLSVTKTNINVIQNVYQLFVEKKTLLHSNINKSMFYLQNWENTWHSYTIELCLQIHSLKENKAPKTQNPVKEIFLYRNDRILTTVQSIDTTYFER